VLPSRSRCLLATSLFSTSAVMAACVWRGWHAPASVAMLDIAKLYRLRAEETREMEKAGAREALSRLRLSSRPASRPPQPVP